MMIAKIVLFDLIIVCSLFHTKSVVSSRVNNSQSDDDSFQKLWKNFTETEYKIASVLRIKVFKGDSYATAEVIDIPLLEPKRIFQHIDHTKPLVLYIHGYNEHSDADSVNTIVEAHLDRGTDNIFVFDWSALALDDFNTVFNKTKDIARTSARVFDYLFDLGLNLETFHFVSHSFGVQIAGFFGKYSRHSIPRITGLDPARPGFYEPGVEHIDATSAKFVDIVHTDSGYYGAQYNTGTVDFYANSGTRAQPGCPYEGYYLAPSDLCNHWRSWRFYAETVKNHYAFPATQCSLHIFYESGLCTLNKKVYFGYKTSTDARGTYYFRTKANSPYGYGI